MAVSEIRINAPTEKKAEADTQVLSHSCFICQYTYSMCG